MVSMVNKFEDTYIGYMFNQAGMPFFVLGHYPARTIEDGKMVIDRSESTLEFQAKARDLKELIRRIESRHKRDMRVPKTWIKQIEDAVLMVQVLEEHKISTKEWADHFYRLVRYLKTI